MGFVEKHPWMTFFLGLAGLSAVVSVVQAENAAKVFKQALPPPPPPLGSPQNPTADQFLQQLEKGQL